MPATIATRNRAHRRSIVTDEVHGLTETYLKDELAESLAGHLDAVPEARALAERFARPDACERVAVRGLIGAARGLLASWLERATGRTVLYLVSHGEAFEE